MADFVVAPNSSLAPASGTIRLDSLTPRDIDTDLLQQLESNRVAMYELIADLPQEQRALVRAAVDAALFCHYAHTRIGTPPIHYSHHLLEVMRRVKTLSFSEGRDTTCDQSRLALRLSVAALHDSMEDIARTFPQITDRLEGFSIVEGYIRERLKTVADHTTQDTICESIRTLSIKNEDDFSDSSYVARIVASSDCLPVKWADVNHNMLTIPDVSAHTGAISMPAQCDALMQASPYYDEFIHQVLVSAKRAEQKVQSDTFLEKKLGKALSKVYSFEGSAGLSRLQKFYQKLAERLQSDPNADVFPKTYTTQKLANVIQSYLHAIQVARDVLERK
jgi:hypothetical protein